MLKAPRWTRWVPEPLSKASIWINQKKYHSILKPHPMPASTTWLIKYLSWNGVTEQRNNWCFVYSNTVSLWKSLLLKSIPIISKLIWGSYAKCADIILEPLKGIMVVLVYKQNKKIFPCNLRISLCVGKFIFHLAIFCNSLIFLIFFPGMFFFIRIIYVPHTFSSNYSFIANYLHVEI